MDVDINPVSGATIGDFEIIFVDGTGETAPVSIRSAGKRTVKAKVPTHRNLQVRLVADGVWAAPNEIGIGGEGTYRLVLEVLPSTSLHGDVLDSPSRKAKDLEVKARISKPQTGRERGSSDVVAEVPCTVEAPKFSCAVPVGDWDIRIRRPGFVSRFLWSAHVTREPFDLGVMQFAPGSSLVGWLVTDGPPAFDTVGLRMTPTEFESSEGSKALEQERRSRLRSVAVKPEPTGFFHFRGVEPGEYMLEATLSDGATTAVPVRLLPGAEAELANPLRLASLVPFEVQINPPLPPTGTTWKLALFPYRPGMPHREAIRDGSADMLGLWQTQPVSGGDYTLHVSDPSGELWHVQQLSLSESETGVSVILEAIQVEGVLSLGRDPVPSASLSFAGEGGKTLSTTTDDEGHFNLLLPGSGDWFVDIRSKKESLKFRRKVKFEIPDSSKGTIKKDIRLPNGRLRGTVIGPDGEPTTAIIMLGFLEGERFRTAVPDAEGKWEALGLTPGTVRVFAWDADQNLHSSQVAATAAAGDFGQEIVLRLVPDIEIEGRLSSAVGGVPGAQIIAEPAQAPLSFLNPAVTGPGGEFTLHAPHDTTALNVVIMDRGTTLRILRTAVPTDGSGIQLRTDGNGGDLRVRHQKWPGTDFYSGFAHVFFRPDSSYTLLENVGRWASVKGEIWKDMTDQTVPSLEDGDYKVCRIAIADLWQALFTSKPNEATCSSVYLSAGARASLSL